MNAAVTQALRLDDVGAASKRHEVYGVTRVKVGRLALPFPGNFLFLKYLPPVKRWGPYRELTAPEWERVLTELEGHGARMTVGVTAGWVESDGGVERGLLEVANHGYTHCVLERGRYRPRLFSGNRREHREFHDWLPAEVHREHVTRAQGILQDFLSAPVLTFVPPGNVFSRVTLAAASAAGLRYVSCLEPGRWGAVEGITFVGDQDVVPIHDRDLVLGGVGFLTRLLSARRGQPFVTVREVGARLEGARR